MADLQGVIDLHVHAGPDVRPRKLDAVGDCPGMYEDSKRAGDWHMLV